MVSRAFGSPGSLRLKVNRFRGKKLKFVKNFRYPDRKALLEKTCSIQPFNVNSEVNINFIHLKGLVCPFQKHNIFNNLMRISKQNFNF